MSVVGSSHETTVEPAVYCRACGTLAVYPGDPEEAAQAAADHRDAHTYRHTCEWSHRLGDFIRTEDCPGCKADAA